MFEAIVRMRTCVRTDLKYMSVQSAEVCVIKHLYEEDTVFGFVCVPKSWLGSCL